MAIVSSGSRAQIQLIHWEQFIASDNPVRVIDAFVDLLDLEQLGFTIKGKSREGRPVFSSDTLLKLYFYGYLNSCVHRLDCASIWDDKTKLGFSLHLTENERKSGR